MTKQEDRTENVIQVSEPETSAAVQKLRVVRHFGTERTSREAIRNLLCAHRIRYH